MLRCGVCSVVVSHQAGVGRCLLAARDITAGEEVCWIQNIYNIYIQYLYNIYNIYVISTGGGGHAGDGGPLPPRGQAELCGVSGE